MLLCCCRHMRLYFWLQSHVRRWSSDDVIKWKHFPRYWPFVRGIHWLPVNSPHKSQWRGAMMFSLIRACINCWVIHRKAGDLRRNRSHYDVTVMSDISIVVSAHVGWYTRNGEGDKTFIKYILFLWRTTQLYSPVLTREVPYIIYLISYEVFNICTISSSTEILIEI